MRFSIQREALLKPLSLVTGVVQRRNTMAILANLLVQTDGSTVRFTATDTESEMISGVDAEVAEGGEVTVPARKLLDICRALPDGTVLDLELGNDRGVIKAGRSRFTLATLPSDEFPVVENLDFSQSLELSAAALSTILDQTSFAMAQQDVRYYLNGLLLELRPGLLRAVATDGHRMALADAEADVAVEEVQQLIVPRKAVLELQRLLNETDGDIRLEFGAAQMRAHFNGTIFTTKLIDAKYPMYESVIPLGADQMVTVDRGLVADALSRASILSNEKFRGVKFEIEPGTLRLSAHNPEQEEAVEELAVDSDVEKLSVGFNVTYVMDALNALDAETVSIFFKDANSSCLVQAADDTSARHVVMPLKL